MIRTQIQLDEETFEAVRRIAFRDHVSISEVIRRSLRETLTASTRAPRRRKLAFVGSGASGRSDISDRHDEALSEDFR